MSKNFLSKSKLPFCKGCGHHLIALNTEKALQKTKNLNPLDVILVTDIGCHGIIDKKFYTHTVHGLHGRAAALAAGISAGLDKTSKKVIVYVGDGGATIGLQHLIEAAHRNINMAVIVHNNMLYGMTGGQPSGLTLCGFKTQACPEGKSDKGYDLCSILSGVGASYVRRIIGVGDFSEQLAEAFENDGFSLVEVVEICPSYGLKYNPGMKLSEIVEQSGLEVKLYTNPGREAFRLLRHETLPSLLEGKHTKVEFFSQLKNPLSIILSGSAGEGVQLAAELFAQAAVASRLEVTKKGRYPVTVGTGFSTAEIIVSPAPIHFTGIVNPDIVIITSKDGLEYCKAMIEQMKGGILFIDESIEIPQTKAKVIRHDFCGHAGARNAALYAIFFFLRSNPIIPIESLVNTVKKSKISDKVDLVILLNSKRNQMDKGS